MINYIKNLPGTSLIRKIILTIAGIAFGVIGCGFGMLMCVGGCSGRNEVSFFIWEIFMILITINLILLGYKKSKRLYISLTSIIVLLLIFLFFSMVPLNF